MTNAQLKEKILRMIEYLEKDLKTEASSGNKGSKSLTFDIFCVFAGRACGRKQTVDVVIEKENGTTRCFEDVHAQLEKDYAFQHIGSKGDLVYDIGQKMEVEKLEEFEEETIEEFMKCIEDLE